MAQAGMRIGQLAEKLGTTTKTLRFYERIGLLKPAVRSESGYRLYDGAAVSKARLVIGLRRLDLTINELQWLLRDDRKTSLRQRLLALMDEKLRAVYLDLSILQGRCEDLSVRHEALLSAPRNRPQDCICDALFQPCVCVAEPPAKGRGWTKPRRTQRKKLLTLPIR